MALKRGKGRRRGKAEGTIFQRGDGRYAAEINLGVDASGKRKKKTVYGRSEAEVQRKLLELRNAVATGRPIEAATSKLGEYLEQWLEIQRLAVQPGTSAEYVQHVNKYLKPRIGGLALGKIKPFDVVKLYAGMAADGKSAVRQHKVGKTLRQALRSAVKNGLIFINPAELVPLPKVTKKPMQVWTAEECRRFLDVTREDRYHALYQLALDTAMRQGELFGLQWQDIDWQTGSINVQRSLENVSGVTRLKPPKSKAGQRRIQLSEAAIEALHGHRIDAVASGHYGPTRQVFVDSQGGFLQKSNFRSRFDALVKAAGVPGIRFHDMRHSSATLLLTAGVHPRVAQEKLGHSQIALTLGTYSHVMPGLQAEAAAKMGAIWKGAANIPIVTNGHRQGAPIAHSGAESGLKLATGG